MFEEFAIKRQGEMWQVRIANQNRVKNTLMSNSECAIYLDKALELVEELASETTRLVRKDME